MTLGEPLAALLTFNSPMINIHTIIVIAKFNFRPSRIIRITRNHRTIHQIKIYYVDNDLNKQQQKWREIYIHRKEFSRYRVERAESEI